MVKAWLGKSTIEVDFNNQCSKTMYQIEKRRQHLGNEIVMVSLKAPDELNNTTRSLCKKNIDKISKLVMFETNRIQ